jgi:integral membrane protein
MMSHGASAGGLRGAFLAFRVMAYLTGVLLILLVFVAIPIQLLGHSKTLESIIGTAHGFLFMVYLVTAVNLGLRLRWAWLKLGLVMLAGTVPFCSFIAERRVRAEVHDVAEGRGVVGRVPSR